MQTKESYEGSMAVQFWFQNVYRPCKKCPDSEKAWFAKFYMVCNAWNVIQHILPEQKQKVCLLFLKMSF